MYKLEESEHMLFSFVIPVFNVEKYLIRCLDSVTNQTYKNFEAVIIDDGSTDSCSRICDDYAQNDNRIRVIHQTNQGLSIARNVGIEVAKGDYIFFLDSDDFLETNALELLIPYTEERYKIISFNLTSEPVVHETRLYEALQYFRESFIRMASWSYIYQRSFLMENNLRFAPDLYYEDTLFTPEAIYKSGAVYVTNLPLYHYEEGRKDSISNSTGEKHLTDFLRIISDLDDFYSNSTLIEVKQLRMQSVISFYIYLYYQQKGYRYGWKYVDALKPFINENTCDKKFEKRALLFCFSPVLYSVLIKCYRIWRRALRILLGER